MTTYLHFRPVVLVVSEGRIEGGRDWILGAIAVVRQITKTRSVETERRNRLNYM